MILRAAAGGHKHYQISKCYLKSPSLLLGKCFQDESSAPTLPAEEENNQEKVEDAPNSGADILNLEPEAPDNNTSPPAEAENAKSTPPTTQQSCELKVQILQACLVFNAETHKRVIW